MLRPFVDRKDSGKQLAQLLRNYKDQPNGVVIGLPRGGVVTAAEVAKFLNLPLDIVVPRKIGAPFNEELAIGAVAQDGQIVWNNTLLAYYNLSPADVADIVAKERNESLRRVQLYRQNRPPLKLSNAVVLLIDDGIATGATIRAAISYLKKAGAGKIVVAAPIIADDVAQELREEVDDVVALVEPSYFGGIGAFYKDFSQTSDEEVLSLLNQNKKL